MLGENESAGFILSVWDELKQTMFISSGYPFRCSSRIKTEHPSMGVFRLRVVSNFVDGDFEETRREGSTEFGRIVVRACVRACVFRPPNNRHLQN